MFLLEPNLDSKLIINQYETKLTTFYCYSTENYQYIELWTNLGINKEWHAISFKHQHDHYYKATVNISSLKPNADYEFTTRYKHKDSDDWNWLGEPGQNGSIYLLDTSLSNKIHPPTFAAVPQLKFIFKQHYAQADLWHFKTQNKQTVTCSSSFPLGSLTHSVHSFTAIIRKGSTWLTPVSGHNNFNNHVNSDEKWQLFLYQDKEQGNIHLWLAINDTADCWFSPSHDNSIDFHHSTENDAHLIIVSSQPQQPIQNLFKVALDYYYQQLGSTRQTLKNHDLPTHLLDKLGYCTWNAFGQDLDMNRLVKGLEDLPISYLLLDDGWQSISKQRQLNGFEMIQQKFPAGLKQSILDLKSKFPSIQHVGVWHTLWGYWNGIDGGFAKEKGYEWVNYQSEQGDEIGIVKDPDMFYREFYQYLQQQGVDFVKVDNQGGFQNLIGLSEQEKLALWDAYRSSLVERGDQYFNGYVIHCMSLTPHILFHPIFSNLQNSLFRNSDDFFPDENSSHSWHIYANIINSLLTSYYPIVPDWDMFQSNHPLADYHAASRAISGGPIYISDPPCQHNPSLINSLLGETRHEGLTLLRSSQPPQPTFHTVFNNPMGTNSLLSMYNINQEQDENQHWIAPPEYYVYAFFNTSDQPQLAVINNISLKKPVLGYVVSGPDQGKCLDELVARVDGMGSTVITLSPVCSLGLLSIACLGLIDKLNGTRAIVQTRQIEEQEVDYYHYQCVLSHRSERCGVWMKSINPKKADFIPRTVKLDDQVAKDWNWDKETGLLVVNMISVPLNISTRDNFTIDIYLEKITLLQNTAATTTF